MRIRLIGRPAIEIDGASRSLAGHKPWGLLAFLLLSSRAATRRELAERLWPEADDPLAALRWALLQARRALEPEARVVEREGRLAVELPAGAIIDALAVVSGALDPAEAADLGTGELLEGHTFGDAPAFDEWLALERQRVASALREALRWAATMLARSSPDEALAVAERALLLDPLNDPLHELIVNIHVTRGDRTAAERHVERADRRYREELGEGVPGTVRRPLERPPLPGVRIAPAVTAKALVQTAQARMDAGDYDAAVAVARRAASEAAAAQDPAVESSALATLGTILIHSVRGRDRESLGLLARAFQLATEAGDTALASEIARETGYVAFLAAEYGSAEQSFHRAIALAERAGDGVRLGKALTFLAASQMDRGDLDASDATLGRALGSLDASGERRFRSFTLSFVARLRLREGRHAEARDLAREALAAAQATGWHGIVPWILTFEGEAELRLGDTARASELFAEGFALGSEMGGSVLGRTLAARARPRGVAGGTPGEGARDARRGARPLQPRARHALVGRRADPHGPGRARGRERCRPPPAGARDRPSRPDAGHGRASPPLHTGPNARPNARLTTLRSIKRRRRGARRSRTMEMLVAVVAMVTLALASLRFGVDSRSPGERI